MAVTLIGLSGLFTRLGVEFFKIRSANLFLGATDLTAGGIKSVGVSYTNMIAQYASTLQTLPDGQAVQLASVRAALNAWKAAARTMAEKIVVEQVHLDSVLPKKDLDTALRELIRQMVGAGTIYAAANDVDASTVSATIATVTGVVNNGSGVLVASVLRDVDARPNELLFAEVMEAECTADQNSGATARRETFLIKGEVAVSDPLAYDWPAGSGASKSITLCDSEQDAAGGNLLYNGALSAFTVLNTPDYWGAPLVGVYGTDILEESSVVLRAGKKSLRFLGQTVAVLSSIAQNFAVASPSVANSGTSTVLEPGVPYAVNCWMRKTAGIAAGVLQIRLLDSANAQVTNDAGSNLLISQTATALSSAAWTAVNGVFILPKTAVPTTVYKLNVRVSTGLTDTESVYVDELAMCEMTQLYTGGPWVAGFAGATAFLKGDRFTVTIANDYAGAMLQEFDRCFKLREKGLQLPSDTAGTETVTDSLIS